MKDSQESEAMPTSRIDYLWRWTGLLLVVALLAIVFLLFDRVRNSDSGEKTSSASSKPSLTVNTIRAKQEESIFEIRSYSGVIRPRRSSDLGFDRGGRIEEVLVADGEIVTEGQTLARLNQDQLQLQKQNLDDALQRAKDNLSELQQDEEDLSTQGLQTRIQELRNELDQFQADLNAADVANQGQPPGSTERLRTVERQIGNLNQTSLSKQIDELDRKVEELDDKSAELELQLEAGLLKAPFDGVIALIHTNKGAAVSPGMPVVRIIEEQRPRAWVGLPIDVVSQIQLGQAAWLTVNDEVYTAVATAILPQLDQSTRTRTVILEIEGIAGQTQIVPGQVVDIQFWVENRLTGIWVPLTSLHHEVEGLWSVYVVEGEDDSMRAGRRFVEVIRLESEFALISGTVAEEDAIVVDGGHRIVDGQAVKTTDITATVQKPGPGQEPGQ